MNLYDLVDNLLVNGFPRAYKAEPTGTNLGVRFHLNLSESGCLSN